MTSAAGIEEAAITTPVTKASTPKLLSWAVAAFAALAGVLTAYTTAAQALTKAEQATKQAVAAAKEPVAGASYDELTKQVIALQSSLLDTQKQLKELRDYTKSKLEAAAPSAATAHADASPKPSPARVVLPAVAAPKPFDNVVPLTEIRARARANSGL